MKSIISALIAAVLMAAGSPVSAAAISGTPSGILAGPFTGDIGLGLIVTNISDGAGNLVSDTTWSFNIAYPFTLSASIQGDDDENPLGYQELHLALFNQSPTTAPYALYRDGSNPDLGNTLNLIDIDTTDLGGLGFMSGSSSGNSSGLLVVSNLAPGTYYLRAWGLTNGTGPFANGGVGTATITAVPLPAAAWLFLSGLGGLGAVRARRRSRQGVVA